jgi:hypothetical protein
MLADSIQVSEKRASLRSLCSDLDRIEARLMITNKQFIQSRPNAWERARATTAIYLANIRIQSRFKFWLLPDKE